MASEIERFENAKRDDPVGFAMTGALSGLMNDVELAGAIIIAVGTNGEQYALKILGHGLDDAEKDDIRDTLDAATKGVDEHMKGRS